MGCMERPTGDSIDLGPTEAQIHGLPGNGGKRQVTVDDVMLQCGRCCSWTRGEFLVVHSDVVLATVLRLSLPSDVMSDSWRGNACWSLFDDSMHSVAVLLLHYLPHVLLLLVRTLT